MNLFKLIVIIILTLCHLPLSKAQDLTLSNVIISYDSSFLLRMDTSVYRLLQTTLNDQKEQKVFVFALFTNAKQLPRLAFKTEAGDTFSLHNKWPFMEAVKTDWFLNKRRLEVQHIEYNLSHEVGPSSLVKLDSTLPAWDLYYKEYFFVTESQRRSCYENRPFFFRFYGRNKRNRYYNKCYQSKCKELELRVEINNCNCLDPLIRQMKLYFEYLHIMEQNVPCCR